MKRGRSALDDDMAAAVCSRCFRVSRAIGLGHLSLQRLFFIILVHVLFTRVLARRVGVAVLRVPVRV